MSAHTGHTHSFRAAVYRAEHALPDEDDWACANSEFLFTGASLSYYELCSDSCWSPKIKAARAATPLLYPEENLALRAEKLDKKSKAVALKEVVAAAKRAVAAAKRAGTANDRRVKAINVQYEIKRRTKDFLTDMAGHASKVFDDIAEITHVKFTDELLSCHMRVYPGKAVVFNGQQHEWFGYKGLPEDFPHRLSELVIVDRVAIMQPK